MPSPQRSEPVTYLAQGALPMRPPRRTSRRRLLSYPGAPEQQSPARCRDRGAGSVPRAWPAGVGSRGGRGKPACSRGPSPVDREAPRGRPNARGGRATAGPPLHGWPLTPTHQTPPCVRTERPVSLQASAARHSLPGDRVSPTAPAGQAPVASLCRGGNESSGTGASVPVTGGLGRRALTAPPGGLLVPSTNTTDRKCHPRLPAPPRPQPRGQHSLESPGPGRETAAGCVYSFPARR